MFKRNSRNVRDSKHAFTLVELLVVIAIISILMGLVVGISGAVQRGAAEARAKAQIANLMGEIERFQSDRGAYPDDWAEFGDWYEERYEDTRYDVTDGTPSDPIDPWGTSYFYDYDSETSPFVYHIGSWGPNVTDDEGEGDDITNRNGALN